ncbi:MAG: hypothetical protein RJA16_392 [Planctomycetota bacterium]|jgi:uncharacterized membrane protein YeiB
MRFASIDILRTIAIVVMVLVHFGENLGGYTPAFAGFGAPLFVFLSGTSYFLWSDARLSRGADETEISKISVRRGLFVLGAGFAFNLFVWLPEEIFIWDVLTFIGVALLILNVVRRMPRSVCILAAVMSMLVAPFLRDMADFAAYWENGYFEYDPTLSDVLIGFLATGYFPLFPWIGLTLAGYATASWLFARPEPDGGSIASPWRTVALGGGLVAIAVALWMAEPWLPETFSSIVLGGWRMFPATTTYVLAATGMAMGLLSLGHRYVDLAPRSPRLEGPLRMAKTFSRYSLTIYVLHHLVHLWPLWIYGLLTTGDPTALWGAALPVGTSLALGVAFLIGCGAVLQWLGPERTYGLEAMMRWICD